MQPATMIKQLLDANKKAFEDCLTAMMVMQEHTVKMMHIFWDRSSFFPQENKKMVEDWVVRCKDSMDGFRENVDKRFKLMEYYLVNAADQMESSIQTVVDKAVPASQVFEVTKRESVLKKKKTIPEKKTVKKKSKTQK